MNGNGRTFVGGGKQMMMIHIKVNLGFVYEVLEGFSLPEDVNNGGAICWRDTCWCQ